MCSRRPTRVLPRPCTRSSSAIPRRWDPSGVGCSRAGSWEKGPAGTARGNTWRRDTGTARRRDRFRRWRPVLPLSALSRHPAPPRVRFHRDPPRSKARRRGSSPTWSRVSRSPPPPPSGWCPWASWRSGAGGSTPRCRPPAGGTRSPSPTSSPSRWSRPPSSIPSWAIRSPRTRGHPTGCSPRGSRSGWRWTCSGRTAAGDSSSR